MGYKKFYVVRGGRCIALVNDYTQALMVAGGNKDRVHEYTNYHLALGLLKKMTEDALEYSQKPIGTFVHCDASVNNLNGSAEFRVMREDKILLQMTDIQYCTPHLAEYLAIVEAHRYVTHYGIEEKIYSDNITAIKWFHGNIPLQIPPVIVATNHKLHNSIKNAQSYVESLTKEQLKIVCLWDSSMWGEIPSDYGRKK